VVASSVSAQVPLEQFLTNLSKTVEPSCIL